jgi:hypothetical protein
MEPLMSSGLMVPPQLSKSTVKLTRTRSDKKGWMFFLKSGERMIWLGFSWLRKRTTMRAGSPFERLYSIKFRMPDMASS